MSNKTQMEILNGMVAFCEVATTQNRTNTICFVANTLYTHNPSDPSWTFAAILREPSERLLSLYLDKWKKSKHELGRKLEMYEFDHPPSFDEFVTEISKVSFCRYCS